MIQPRCARLSRSVLGAYAAPPARRSPRTPATNPSSEIQKILPRCARLASSVPRTCARPPDARSRGTPATNPLLPEIMIQPRCARLASSVPRTCARPPDARSRGTPATKLPNIAPCLGRFAALTFRSRDLRGPTGATVPSNGRTVAEGGVSRPHGSFGACVRVADARLEPARHFCGSPGATIGAARRNQRDPHISGYAGFF
jgi:hypothetical protein